MKIRKNRASDFSLVVLRRTGKAATLFFFSIVCKCRVQKRMNIAVTTQNTRGQSVYLAPGSVGTPRSRLFLGRPYLSLVLPPLPPPPPPDHTPLPGNLTHRRDTHKRLALTNNLHYGRSVTITALTFVTRRQFSMALLAWETLFMGYLKLKKVQPTVWKMEPHPCGEALRTVVVKKNIKI